MTVTWNTLLGTCPEGRGDTSSLFNSDYSVLAQLSFDLCLAGASTWLGCDKTLTINPYMRYFQVEFRVYFLEVARPFMAKLALFPHKNCYSPIQIDLIYVWLTKQMAWK